MPISMLDKTDYAIIAALQDNGRLTNIELAERINLSPSPCLRRVRKLEEAGIITGYHAEVDAKAYGLSLTLFVRVTLERHNKQLIARFEQAVQEMEEMMECHLLTGSADYLLKILVRDLADYERFMRDEMHEIPGIASIDTSFSLVAVKQKRHFGRI